MNREQLSKAVAEITGGTPAEADAHITAFLQVLTHRLAGAEPITITGLGGLQPYIRNARKARNPQTGNVVDVDARMWVRYRPAPRLLAYANGTIPLPKHPRDMLLKAPKAVPVPLDGDPGDME